MALWTADGAGGRVLGEFTAAGRRELHVVRLRRAASACEYDLEGKNYTLSRARGVRAVGHGVNTQCENKQVEGYASTNSKLDFPLSKGLVKF